jgi:prepilin-type N-terminal cleavage/methylation domain-containing protein
MKRRLIKRKLGYTLIEVLVSLFLISMGAIMYTATLPMAAKGSRMVGNYQQASSLVQHKIDQLRAVGYGRLDYTDLLASLDIIDASPTSSPYSFTTIDGLSAIYPNATGTIAVSDFSSTIKQVTVTLTWTGSALKQDNGSVSAVALIANQ